MTLLSIIVSILAVYRYVPQLQRLYKTKSGKDLSRQSMTLDLTSCLLYIVITIDTGLMIIFYGTLVRLVLLITTIYLKNKYEKR